MSFRTTICTHSQHSLIVAGKPISVSCAYSGRVAVAYRMGGIRIKNDNPDDKFVNLCVSIYECESSGTTARPHAHTHTRTHAENSTRMTHTHTHTHTHA